MPYVFKQKSKDEKRKLKKKEKIYLIIGGIVLILIPIYLIIKNKKRNESNT